MKTMLERIEEQRIEKMRSRKPSLGLLRIHVRLTANSTARIGGGSPHLVSVGSDYLELSSSADGKSPYLLDRKQIAEVFFS